MGNAPGKQRSGGRKYVHWDTAVPPAPPGKPHLVPGTPQTQPDVVNIRWEPPVNDGGAPVTGYLVEHRRTGSPHWVRATPSLVPQPELALSGLEPGWRYQFRVSAQNAVGLSEPSDISEPLTVTLNRSAAAAPHFLEELRDCVTLENETAEFNVVVRGTPPPKVAWYKDGFEIFSSRRMRVVTEGDQSSLVIFQAAFSDEGDIKCTATNRVGHVVSKAKLRLEAPPRVRLPRQYEDGLLFEMGEVIRVKVSVVGRPLPRVTWLHNGEPIPFGGRYEVTNTERASALRVSEARRADRGEYQVRATSRLGEDTASFLITVTDRPTPPGRARVVSTLGRSVTLAWNEPDDDGGCKIGNYIVEYYRIGWNVWLKAATCRQLNTVLEDLIEGSEYKFRVKAENPYGVSDPSDESDVVFIPDPRRGLLEPPARKRGTKTPPKSGEKMAMDETPPEQIVPPVPSQALTDANKRKQPDVRSAPPPAKKNAAADTLLTKTKQWETVDRPLPVISFESALPSDRKRNKENAEPRKTKEPKEDSPPPVPPKTARKVKGPVPPQRPQHQPPAPAAAQRVPRAGTPAQLPPTLSKGKPQPPIQRRGSLEDMRPKAVEGKLLLSPASPLTPREEDDSILHGSSELMLVLLPEGADAEGDGDADVDGEDGPRTKATRRSVPDFGQDSLQDQVAPPLSLSAPELGSGEPPSGSGLRNAVSSTELLHEKAMARFYQAVAAEEAQKAMERRRSIESAAVPFPVVPRSRGPSLQDEEEARRLIKPLQAPASPRPPPRKETEEEEQMHFALVRQRLEAEPGGRLPRHAPPRTDSEDSHEDADASLDYEEDEDDMEDDLDDEPYEPRGPAPRIFHGRFSDEEEEDTYHPPSMVPRSLPPPVPPHARSPLPEPPKLMPKPILKKRRGSSPERPLSPSEDIEMEIRRQRSPAPEPPDRTPTPAVPVTPAPVVTPITRPTAVTTTIPTIPTIPIDQPRLRQQTSRQSSLEDEEALQRVISEHYGDIIREYGRPKKSGVTLYTKTDELKAAAERRQAGPASQHPGGPKPATRNQQPVQSAKLTTSQPESEDKKPEEKVEEEEEEEGTTAPKKSWWWGWFKKDTDEETKLEDTKKQEEESEEGSEEVSEEESEEESEESEESDEEEEEEVVLKKEEKEEPKIATGPSVVHEQPWENVATYAVPEIPKPSALEVSTPTVVLSEEERTKLAEKKVRSFMDYITDVAMFTVACWLYVFEDELYAVPLLLLMVYRQLRDALRNRLPRFMRHSK